MIRDDRFNHFNLTHVAQLPLRMRSRILYVGLHSLWTKALTLAGAIVLCLVCYGVYNDVDRENNHLRSENERHRQQLNVLKTRVEAIENASRRLAEMSGVDAQDGEASARERGRGGPVFVAENSKSLNEVENQTSNLEQQLRRVESALEERARVPSIWPVEGYLTDGFGMRRAPFDNSAVEFHAGQDVAAGWGTSVAAAGNGTVTFAGVQNGYGQLVVVDHGNNLTTRYGHLSSIDVSAGQTVKRGDCVGSVGSTGRSTGPHLHYEVRIGDTPVNPRDYLPSHSY
ncbi:MAG: peptidoglycan DD-metalloendopeptidase family protein [Pyrinomonadaceae bacterium]|nr:peptidoglycan DD-metalloendopeptidase family protein [Pyrinomonadaceae bacterium]